MHKILRLVFIGCVLNANIFCLSVIAVNIAKLANG